MNVKTWEDVKDLIGEDLSLFMIFMASLEASEILEGFRKVAKGAKFLSDETFDAMYKEMTSGIARETLEHHVDEKKMELHQLDDQVFLKGLDDLMDWMEMTSHLETSNYFTYLSRWDLEGHNWISEKPKSFAEFNGIAPVQ